MEQSFAPHMPIRPLAAEWTADGTILLAWPHADTDWNYMLDQVETCYINMVKAFVKYHRVLVIAPDTSVPQRRLNDIAGADKIFYATVPGNDTWARDFGPLTMQDAYAKHYVLDCQFNGWGLKFPSNLDNMVTSRLCDSGVITVPRLNRLGFTLEGGGIDSNGLGDILTTSRCQLSPNRNGDLSRQQIDKGLQQLLGAERILWLEHGALAGDDTDSHVDTLARFAPDDTIVYAGCSNPDDPNFADLAAMRDELRAMRTRTGSSYNLLELPSPDPIYDMDEDIQLPATYANFLVTAKAVFMPVYNQPANDLLAAQMLCVAYSRPVETVDCNALIRQHGSLHCATMMLPDPILSF